MKDMSKFQIVFIGLFLAISIFSVLVFADVIHIGGKKTAQQNGSGNIIVWGTAPFQSVSPAVQELNQTVKDYTVMYREKKKSTIEQELIEALASGKGPDMILFTDDQILRIQDKLYLLPYTSFPQASFVASFVSEAGLLVSQNGLVGLPIGIDPLVMYYNQDMFDSANILFPPKTWTEISEDIIPKLTKKDPSNNSQILTSAIALGTYTNITHAKDILSGLFFQTGQSIAARSQSGFESSLSSGTTNNGAVQALDFYMSFSNPAMANYSWNKSMKPSRDAFVSGKLAIYFGFASEIGFITQTNPNLHFMVAKFPQSDQGGSSTTLGRMYSVGILKNSKNLNTAFVAASAMTQPYFVTALTKAINIVPARRDMLLKKPNDTYSGVFYESALFSRGWYDPQNSSTELLFRDVIEKVYRGEQTSKEAIQYFGSSLNKLLKAVSL